MVDVDVEYNGQQQTLPLFVVKNGGPALFGHQWLDWSPSNTLLQHSIQGDCSNNWKKWSWSLKKYFKVDIKGRKAKLNLKEGMTPKFHKARRVPYQTWGQRHLNVFKYKYYWGIQILLKANVFKYKYIEKYFKYFFKYFSFSGYITI